jgi:hypothetical protein
MAKLMLRSLTFLALAVGALTMASCESGGHFTLLGYSTRPNYDPCIKTVYVPVFENATFRRGIEYDLTRAVITAIEQKTPYKVVSDRDGADTELTGTIVALNKNILNRNQLNEQRETETVLTVAVVWKDLRSGEILSQPKATPPGGPAFGTIPDLAPGAGGVPTQDNPNPGAAVAANVPVRPALVTSIASYIPEIGQSYTTGLQLNFNRLATQIVALMEKPW